MIIDGYNNADNFINKFIEIKMKDTILFEIFSWSWIFPWLRKTTHSFNNYHLLILLFLYVCSQVGFSRTF